MYLAGTAHLIHVLYEENGWECDRTFEWSEAGEQAAAAFAQTVDGQVTIYALLGD